MSEVNEPLAHDGGWRGLARLTGLRRQDRRPGERPGLVQGSRSRQPLLVVGFDGSAAACRAAAYALGQARRQGARLLFVYVSNDTSALAGLVPELLPYTRESAAAVTAQVREQLAAVLGTAEVPWGFLHRQGRPITELAGTADTLRADAVIVGASRPWLSRSAGSVATRLLRSRHWPVTVVP
jgi:nucleotide-binding universal stress UspA family protein